MRFEPVEYLPYMYRDMTPRVLGVELGIMLAHRDVIGLTKGVMHIEEFHRYACKPVIMGKPKRYKYQRN